jgi:two-component system sensor histidine kinase KdpD
MGAARIVGLLREPADRRPRFLAYGIAVVGPALVILAFLPARVDIEPLTVSFVLLVVVVVAAAVGRLGPGIVASVLGFLSFNFFFIPPYGTFTIADPEHVVSLFVFLGLSVLISFLFARATDRADAADERASELRTLQGFSRDLVVQGPGEETYRSLLTHLLERFSFAAAALFVQAERGGLEERVVVGAAPGTLSASWNPSDPGRPPERLPLSLGTRNLGLLVLVGERPPLEAAEGRVLRAVCDQLALVLERDRLLRHATETEVLRQTDALRRSLLAAVSHDLRSPLAAIKASVTDLLDVSVDRDAAERGAVLETIDLETDRLDSLVANLLDMSRIEAGVLTARPESVDLVEIVTTEIDAVSRRWPEVSVRSSLDEDRAVVVADPVYLPRVLANLLDNAARAALRSEHLDVEVTSGHDPGRADGRGVVLRIVDHGGGMGQTDREQLFYPFYRLEEREAKLGAGLGLAIAKGFVELMDGSLWVEDTPGGGATFAVALPGAPS